MTKLGKIQASGGTTTAPSASRLSKFHALGSRGEETTIPMLGRVYVQLIAHERVNEIESQTFQEMERLKLELNGLNAITFDTEKAVRTLAAGVFDADDPAHATPFGTVEEWSGLDADLILAAWTVYNDCRYRLDPMGDGVNTDEDMAGIRFAISKKNVMALRLFGLAKLSRYLLTTEAPQEASQTPPLSAGESSPDSSILTS